MHCTVRFALTNLISYIHKIYLSPACRRYLWIWNKGRNRSESGKDWGRMVSGGGKFAAEERCGYIQWNHHHNAGRYSGGNTFNRQRRYDRRNYRWLGKDTGGYYQLWQRWQSHKIGNSWLVLRRLLKVDIRVWQPGYLKSVNPFDYKETYEKDTKKWKK